MKPGSKYYPLYQRLAQLPDDTCTFTMDELEACIESKLPPTARQKSAWWANRSKGASQSQAWVQAGYHVDTVDFEQQRVVFKKFQTEYKIQREDGAIKWDQAAIRALRLHMNLTQSQFAEAMGVRRQTISEWENGVYAPDRSTMKHLGLVAKTSAFDPTDSYQPPTAE
ncbi:helix-turn-helix transcriptional regulator [Leptolyngbya iicbica]|uniref:XRE family transcriptional regulator n=2 Tax=Cyanophyceae TaxID=3028117 RepID=A0A4Q7E3C4_9CYAN|nr:helix-turn-helix transcriptional regulator [Leptolyngbya sp. LK]RZM75959.1 XRE family transcriptional regulator [Leptolyngbya sp. LK]